MSTATATLAPRKKRVPPKPWPRKFEDLPKAVQEAAIEKWRDNGAQDDFDQVHETLEYDLHEYYGLSGCKLYASLNCCQGDGVAFEGSVDIDNWAKAAAEEANEKDRDTTLRDMLTHMRCIARLMGVEDDLDIYAKIEHSGHYYHWNSMEVSVTCDTWYQQVKGDEQEILDGLIGDIEGWCKDRVKEISRAMESDGYSQLDAYSSDEYIREYLEVSDHYEFDEDGSLA